MGKYEDKVNKAKAETTELATLPTEALAFIQKGTDGSQLLEQAGAGKVRLGVQLYDMEPGDTLTGRLYNKGSTMLADPNTGEMRSVNTWQIELRNPKNWNVKGPDVSILGAAALDRQLDGFIEGNGGVIDLPVIIFRGGKTKTSRGRQLNDYQAGILEEFLSKVVPAGSTAR